MMVRDYLALDFGKTAADAKINIVVDFDDLPGKQPELRRQIRKLNACKKQLLHTRGNRQPAT